MNKASRIVRRSSIRLKSLSGGHSDLLMIISQLQEVKNTFKAFVKAQAVLADDFLKWSSSGMEVNAIHKTFVHYSELSQLWTEVQKEFSESIKAFKSEFEQILHGEQHVGIAREELKCREESLEKCENDLAKNKDSTAKTQILQAKIKRCEKASELARNELTERIKENEAVKLIRLKKGLKRFGMAYVDMGHKCNSIHKAHFMITQELPDVEGKNIQELMYRETTCESHVRDARNQVCLYNCHASTAISPPYSPTDHINNLSLDMSNVSVNNRSSNDEGSDTLEDSLLHPSAPPQSHYSSMGSISPSSPIEPVYPLLPSSEKDFTRQQGRTRHLRDDGNAATSGVQNQRAAKSSPSRSIFFKRINSKVAKSAPPENFPMPYHRSKAKQAKQCSRFSAEGISSKTKPSFHFRRSAPKSPAPMRPRFDEVNKTPPYNPFDYANISGC